VAKQVAISRSSLSPESDGIYCTALELIANNRGAATLIAITDRETDARGFHVGMNLAMNGLRPTNWHCRREASAAAAIRQQGLARSTIGRLGQ
jgi:hypothetical protein